MAKSACTLSTSSAVSAGMPSIKCASDLRLWHEAVAMVPRDQIVPIGLGGQTNEANLAGVCVLVGGGFVYMFAVRVCVYRVCVCVYVCLCARRVCVCVFVFFF